SSAHLTSHELRIDGQLGGCKTERSTRRLLGPALHVEHDLARLLLDDVALHVTLAATHTHLDRLLRDRQNGKHTNPDHTTARHVPRHRTTCGFDLARGHTGTRRALQAVLAERHVVAAQGHAGVAALEGLAELGSLGLHHGRLLGALGVWGRG